MFCEGRWMILGCILAGAAASCRTTTEDVLALSVPEMVCEMCQDQLTGVIGGLDGIDRIEFDMPQKSITVTFDPTRVDPAAIENAVLEAGYSTGARTTTSRSNRTCTCGAQNQQTQDRCCDSASAGSHATEKHR